MKIRTFVLSILMFLLFSGIGFAQVDIEGPETHGAFSPVAGANLQQGQTQSNTNTIVNSNHNLDVNTNIFAPHNSNRQRQSQGQIQGQQQKQGQGQGQDQFGYVAPVQEVSFSSPTQLLNLPSQAIPELNFGNGKMLDATASLPAFDIYGIKALKREAINKVLNVNANVKFKNLYEAVLSDAADVFADLKKEVAKGSKKGVSTIRYQIIRAEAQKSWTSGGNVGGGGSYLPISGLAGASGAGSIIPTWGGTKADDLFTVIFVEVTL